MSQKYINPIVDSTSDLMSSQFQVSEERAKVLIKIIKTTLAEEIKKVMEDDEEKEDSVVARDLVGNALKKIGNTPDLTHNEGVFCVFMFGQIIGLMREEPVSLKALHGLIQEIGGVVKSYTQQSEIYDSLDDHLNALRGKKKIIN